MKLVLPDTTVKSTCLLYESLSLIGHDNTDHRDFEQPIVKSYIVADIGATPQALFIAGTDVSLSDFAKIQRITIAVADQSTGALLTAPTDKVKIYCNLLASSEANDANTPFSYLMSSIFEFGYVNKWLYSLYVRNTTGSNIKVFVQLARYKEGDQNFDPNFYKV